VQRGGKAVGEGMSKEDEDAHPQACFLILGRKLMLASEPTTNRPVDLPIGCYR